MKPIKVSTDIFCASCGTLLRSDVDTLEADTDVRVTVIPCRVCLDVARESGYMEGATDTAERYSSTGGRS